MHRISASTLQQSYQTRTTHQRSVCRWDWGCHAIYSALPILHIYIIFVILGRPWVECAQLMAGHFVELHGNAGWTPGSDAWYSGSERGLDICSSCIWDDGWWMACCDASMYQEPEVERKRQNLIMESVWIPGHELFQPRELSSHHGQSYDVGWNIIWGAKQSSVEGDWGHCTPGKRSFLDIDSSELSFLAVRDKDRILQLLSESTGNILDDEARLLWLLINSSSFGHVCILHKSTLQCWRAFWRSSSIPLPPQRQCCPKMLSENATVFFSAKSKCPFTLCSRGISQNRRACCRAGRARKKQESEGQCIVCKILQDYHGRSQIQTFPNIQSERIVCAVNVIVCNSTEAAFHYRKRPKLKCKKPAQHMCQTELAQTMSPLLSNDVESNSSPPSAASDFLDIGSGLP